MSAAVFSDEVFQCIGSLRLRVEGVDVKVRRTDGAEHLATLLISEL